MGFCIAPLEFIPFKEDFETDLIMPVKMYLTTPLLSRLLLVSEQHTMVPFLCVDKMNYPHLFPHHFIYSPIKIAYFLSYLLSSLMII